MRIERPGEVAPPKSEPGPALASPSELLARLFPGQQPSEAAQHDALKHLQRRHGLEPTGLPTAATIDGLQREVDWLAHERTAEQESPLPVQTSGSAKPGPARFDPHRARVEAQLRRPTPDVRRALIHGVGMPRGSGREGAEGALGTEHAELVRLRAWMDSARGTRDTVTTDAAGQPRATHDLFEPL